MPAERLGQIGGRPQVRKLSLAGPPPENLPARWLKSDGRGLSMPQVGGWFRREGSFFRQVPLHALSGNVQSEASCCSLGQELVSSAWTGSVLLLGEGKGLNCAAGSSIVAFAGLLSFLPQFQSAA